MKADPFITYRLREPVNAITHLVSAIISLLGTLILFYFAKGNALMLLTFAVYGASLIFLFSASGIYHSVSASDGIILKLRKMDHAAIYLLIAGTYTPICIYFFDGFLQFGMPALVWIMAIIGLLVKLWVIQTPRWVTVGIYLIMGWVGVFAVGEIINNMPVAAIWWLVAGGLFYTFGAIIYMTKLFNFKPGIFGFHEIWHIFVMLGALSHFILILCYIAMA